MRSLRQAKKPALILVWSSSPLLQTGHASSCRATIVGLSGIWRSANAASRAARRAAHAVARRLHCWRRRIRRCGASGGTFTTRQRSPCYASDTIYHEDLGVANMVRNHHLAKSISDAGWGRFLTILTFKAASAGKPVVAVNPALTSQACSGCGVMIQKGLSVRWHSCPTCGTSLHRDHNAAKNIQWRGQRLRGLAGLPAGSNREPVEPEPLRSVRGARGR